jgi:hypothetical protein
VDSGRVNQHPHRSVLSRRASPEFIPDASDGPTSRRMRSPRSTSGGSSPPPFRPSARSGGPPLPAADFCAAVRQDGSALSPEPGHPAALPRSAVIPSGHTRPMYQVAPSGGWRALRWRARSPRRYPTSSRVRVPRPARAFHAACRPHLAVTPWRFPCPSAPRIPGQGPCTPTHDRMHGTHAGPEPRASARRLQALVRQYLFRRPSRGLPAVCVVTLRVGVWE